MRETNLLPDLIPSSIPGQRLAQQAPSALGETAVLDPIELDSKYPSKSQSSPECDTNGDTVHVVIHHTITVRDERDAE